MKRLLFLLVLGVCCCGVKAQDYWAAGIEYQAYPTGHQPGLRIERGLSEHHAIDFRVGANIINERDEGVQDLEEGNGLGFTAGYRYYLKPENNKLFGSFRTDVWFNEIDWVYLSQPKAGE